MHCNSRLLFHEEENNGNSLSPSQLCFPRIKYSWKWGLDMSLKLLHMYCNGRLLFTKRRTMEIAHFRPSPSLKIWNMLKAPNVCTAIVDCYFTKRRTMEIVYFRSLSPYSAFQDLEWYMIYSKLLRIYWIISPRKHSLLDHVHLVSEKTEESSHSDHMYEKSCYKLGEQMTRNRLVTANRKV